MYLLLFSRRLWSLRVFNPSRILVLPPPLCPLFGIHSHKATSASRLISLSFSQKSHSYLCVLIHCLELKLCDGLPHALLYPHPQALYHGQRIIHRAKSDMESLSQLQWQKSAGGTPVPSTHRSRRWLPSTFPVTPFLAGTQKWVLLGKSPRGCQKLPLSLAESRGTWSPHRTSNSVHFKEDCSESTPIQGGNQVSHLPHWLHPTA